MIRPTTVNKSGLIWHILYTHFCVKITCWLIISQLCGLSASVYIKPGWEKNTLEFSGAKFPQSFYIILNGKIYICTSFCCLWREKIQVSCPKLKKIRITILMLQAKYYLLLFQTQKDLDSFAGKKIQIDFAI